MSETILKGKINYYTYIWHTEKGACEKCQALDGLNFKNPDEIPDKPHPNCRCRIEVSEENGNKDDLCDCWKFYDEIEEMIGDLQSLEEEMESEQNDIIIFLDSLNKNIKKYIQNEINNLIDCFNKIATFIEAIKIFKSNFEQLLNTQNGAYDKYYHAKANCEATQLGHNGEKAAEFLSNSKEQFDIYVKSFLQAIKTKQSYKDEILKKVIDGKDDQKANYEGRQMGKKFPNGICGDMLEYKKPKQNIEVSK